MMSRIAVPRTQLPVVLLGLLAAVAVALAACTERDPVDPSLDVPAPELAEPPDGLIVSEPIVGGAGASHVDGSAAEGSSVVYVSAKPGTFEGATSVDIRNVTTGDPPIVGVPVLDGGFDPVALEGSAGDELELSLRTVTGQVSVLYVEVLFSRPPVVVRTRPSKGRTDVALSVAPVVIFSEPVDPGTLTDESVRLLRDGEPVAATVALDMESLFAARLVPDALLQPSTTYELLVSTDVHDLEGEALEQDLSVTFTTRAITATLSIVSGDGQTGWVGSPLADSFVVRVSDIDGTALENVLVEWEAHGSGALDGFDAGGAPIDRLETRTDADGLARSLLVPTVFADFPTEARLPQCADGCATSSVIFGTDTRDSGVTLTVVSGDLQTADAGQWSTPLVARLTGGDGTPVPHAEVRWEKAYGEGTFFADSLWGGVSTWTDAEGLTQAAVVPLWFAPVDVEAYVSGRPAAVFRIDASDPDASITIVSGNGQVGKANEALDEPLVVRVTNGRGEPVERLGLRWTSSGSFGESGFSGLVAGLDSVDFVPHELGTVTALVQLPGIPPREVLFTAEASVFVIELLPLPYTAPTAWFSGNWWEEECWWGQCYLDTETRIPAGYPVEWVNRLPNARIVSTAAPAGGLAIGSGMLGRDERYTFVPDVPGTWEYVDEISGATAKLTVY